MSKSFTGHPQIMARSSYPTIATGAMSKQIPKLLMTVVTILPALTAGPPRLVVQVSNLSHADAKLLSQAEEAADLVFSEAGIQTAWVTTETPAPRKLTIQINPGRSKLAATRTDEALLLGYVMAQKSDICSVFHALRKR